MLTITLLIPALNAALRSVALKAKAKAKYSIGNIGNVVILAMVVFVASCVTEPPIPEQINSSAESENRSANIGEKDTESSETTPSETTKAETNLPASKEKGMPEVTTLKPPETASKLAEEPSVSVEPTETIAKVTPAIPTVTPAAKEPGATLPSSPNHFIVTAEKKNASHPFFGKGHQLGFVVNGKQGQDIVVRRGETYQLEVKTDPKHDVYISSKAIGWGSSAWTKGVEGAFIYQGIIGLKPDKEAPDVLYYSCRNHPYMGGRIIVLNPGQDIDSVDIAKTTTAVPGEPSQVSSPIPVTQINVTAAIVNQKLMFADMLANSSSSKRVTTSGISDAIDKQNKAITLIATSRKQLEGGKNAEALQSATQAVDMLKQAKKLVPSQADMTQIKLNYADLQESIENFEASHKKTSAQLTKKEGKKAVVAYDTKKVEGLKSSAAQASLKGNYPKAVAELTQAQRLITASIQKMLDSKTIVYDLNFESPQEEYEYELKRFGGYEELIPIAIDAKKPTEGAKQLMQTYLTKGQKLRNSAIKTASGGDYPTGIAMLLDATKEVRRALRMIGVSQ